MLRMLRVPASEHPVALALREDRGLEVQMRDRLGIPDTLRELERALDVLARSLVVALAAIAAGAPVEDVRDQEVGREARALGQRERLVEQGERGRVALEQVPADTHPVQHL